MAQILPRDLPPVPGGVVNPSAANIIDDGSGVWQATPQQIADAGAPINSQAQAEAGLVNTGRMTPLRVNQAIAALGVSQAVLASPTGGEMVGTPRDNTVSQELTWTRAATPASLDEFYDASNGAAADRMALEAAAASGRAVSWRGTLTMDQAPVLPVGSMILGEGSTSDNGTRGRSCIVRGFAGSGPLLVLQSDTVLRNIDIDGDNQGTGDNIKIVGERVTLDNVSTRKAGRHGVWIGDLDNDTLNANCWQIFSLKSLNNAGHGVFIHHTSSIVTGTFPQGEPNVNAGSMFGADVRSNGGDGIKVGNAIDNRFYGPVVQSSAGRNFHFDADARGHAVLGSYSEAGGSGDLLAAGANGNAFLFTGIATMPVTDNGNLNMVAPYSADLGGITFQTSLSIGAVFGSGVGGHLNLYNDNLDLGAQIFGRPTGVGSEGKGVATAKRNGNTPADVFEWIHGAGINILSGGLQVAGTQVVGARGAAVADATDAATVITQLNALLARLRAHGLIAP